MPTTDFFKERIIVNPKPGRGSNNQKVLKYYMHSI